MYDPDKYGRATIVERRDLGPELWMLRLQPEVELPFRPGQYVTLGLQLNGRIIERPYSIVSAPQEDAIEIFIERVPEGELSQPLYDLALGDALAVRKRCKGLFLKDLPLAQQPHLFVATVTGVAPFVSLVRSLARDPDRSELSGDFSVTLLHGASRSHEFGYVEELSELSQQLSWFSYVPTVSRPAEEPDWTGEVGRVEDVLRKYADKIEFGPGHGGVYLCGNPQMIHNARTIMRRRRLDNKAIREEQYWPD